jgi:hypothetical protein
MPMELKLKTAEVTIPQAIENIEALKQELMPKIEFYSSLVVTANSISDAKKDKAALNKLKKAVDEQRISAKKQALAMYEPLEKQCKELTALIDEPIQAIDTQIKAFDEIRKAEKRKELEDFFEKINTLDFLKLDDVLDPKWANTTVKVETLKYGISAAVQKLVEDMREIRQLYDGSPLITAILDRFAETKDKGAALAYVAVLEKREKQRQELEQIEREKEAARQAETLVEKTYRDSEGQNRTEQYNKVTEPTLQAEEKLLTGAFRVTCTRAQLLGLRQYMIDNNIRFEIVKGGN